MHIDNLSTPSTVKKKLPLTPPLQEKIALFRKKAQEVSLRKDSQVALALGPCSIHHFEASLEYGSLLSSFFSKLHSLFFPLMRVFVQKPRTSLGWKGFCYDPFLDFSEDIEEGIFLSRKLMIELTKKNIPIATELLDPFLFPFFDDLITWGFIGARTTLSPIHRTLASTVNFPVGFKNTIEGSIEATATGIKVSQKRKKALVLSEEGTVQIQDAPGNPYSHLVLRGSLYEPNFSYSSIEKAKKLLLKEGLTPSFFIDCSHGNGIEGQEKVFFTCIEYLLQKEKDLIGIMLESYWKKGKQLLSPKADPYISVTDACLSWEETEEMLEKALSLLSSDTLKAGVLGGHR